MEPIVSAISAVFTQAGPGGVIVLSVMGLAGFIYLTVIRWILQAEEGELSASPKTARYYRSRTFNK